MFILNKNDIKSFPFHEAERLTDSQLEKWAVDHNLTAFNAWMLPQIYGYYGAYTATKNSRGEYESKSLYLENINNKPWDIGLWRVITRLGRSKLVKSQNTKEFSKYSSLVPILIAALKDAQGIPYSSWSREKLEVIIGDNLFEAATAEIPEVTKDRALELRAQGLTVKSGPAAGSMKKPISSWTLTGLQNTEWFGLPSLTLTMLGQIWVADPSLRTSNMILDPNDWDNMPDPLIEQEVLKSSEKYSRKTTDVGEAMFPTW